MSVVPCDVVRVTRKTRKEEDDSTTDGIQGDDAIISPPTKNENQKQHD